MKKAMKDKFLPSYYLQETITLFHNMEQGGGRPVEVMLEFEELMMKCDMRVDGPHILVGFLGGLDTKIANVVELQPYFSLEELILLPHKIERQHKLMGRKEYTRPTYKLYIKPHKPTNPITRTKPHQLNTATSHHYILHILPTPFLLHNLLFGATSEMVLDSLPRIVPSRGS